MIKKCRISEDKDLIPILDLGLQPLANSLKKNVDDKEQLFPLSISFSKKSSLVQLDYTVDKEKLFNEYLWVTGTSKQAKEYSKLFFENITGNIKLKNEDLIIEIASNDGTFLKPFLDKGYVNILGVDPAMNIVDIAKQNNINTLAQYWGLETSKKIKKEKGTAKLIFARNVIPHVSELDQVMLGIYNILDNEGTGVIEFHYAGKILSELHYDSIYHEHLCYFSIQSLSNLLKKYSLYPFHIEESPTSGGSLSIFFSKNKKSQSIKLKDMIQLEIENEINLLSSWKLFADRTFKHRNDTNKLLKACSSKKIIGFGSSARSQTYLNFCKITKNQVSTIIDNNPLKQGLYTPGSSIPIVSIDKGLEMKPDLIFILGWNFSQEIMEECKAKGFKGNFITPFPGSPKIIENI